MASKTSNTLRKKAASKSPRSSRGGRKYAIGIDLGGTNVRLALVDRRGLVLGRNEESNPSVKSPRNIISLMAKRISLIRDQMPAGSILTGIGVGAPGGIDAESGIVTQSPHLPLWNNVPLGKLLYAQTGLPTRVDNDANCFALGEQRFGGGRGRKNVLAITMGTGIGGGLILNGQIWHGDSGMAGEFGHMVIDVNGLPCACGGRGCFEVYASGTALARMAQEEISKKRKTSLRKLKILKGEAIQEAADGGDALALELFHRMGTSLGVGIANLVNMTGVTHVILGGKVIRSWQYFYDSMRQAIDHQCFRQVALKTEITPAVLGDDAGLLGAASLAF